MDGFDVSGNSGVVDFDAARRSGMQFCFLRAGRGKPASGTDPAGLDLRWSEYLRDAQVASLRVGGYWRFFPSVDLRVQLDRFCARLLEAGSVLQLPPMCDFEDVDGLDRVALTRWINSAIVGVASSVVRTPLLYANRSFLRDQVDAGALAAWPLALARWTSDPTWPVEQPTVWQYAANVRDMPWATGPVDLQRMREAP